MSVVDVNKIDGIAVNSNDDNRLMLLITDHLDWTKEYDHLLLLQKKINAYISFLESEQYREIYPEKQFFTYIIEIHFKYGRTPNCIKFIDTINKQLSTSNILIEAIES
ncbi:MAG: hypothetical protein K0R34_695 [Herbinix sp.]|jgi:hypothetical protein|nr:hypothetical protein [Herbinix sp.]